MENKRYWNSKGELITDRYEYLNGNKIDLTRFTNEGRAIENCEDTTNYYRCYILSY